MMVSITDGWLSGTLPGPGGKEYPVKRFAQSPYYSLAQVKPQLVLHTTETDGYVEHLEYPSQWQVGEGIIGQHKPLWAKGDALKGDTSNDPYAMQIEIVGRSQLDVWLPKPGSLGPLVALMAFLHQRDLVKTAVGRPSNYWLTRLDRGPQASTSYYRRAAGLWPTTAGVYGHVDIPLNDHWDPGSLDYPKLFEMVRAVVTGGAASDEMSDYEKGMAAFAEAARNGSPDRIPDPGWSAEKAKGFRDARLLYNNPIPGSPGPHVHNYGNTISGTTDAA